MFLLFKGKYKKMEVSHSATVTNGQVFQHDPNKTGHWLRSDVKHLTLLKEGNNLIYKLCKWTVLGTLSSSCYV